MRNWGILFLALPGLGCSGETWLVIEVSSDLDVPAQVDEIEFAATGADSAAQFSARYNLTGGWPHTLRLAPAGDENEAVAIRVTVYKRGGGSPPTVDEVVQQMAEGQFREGEVTFVRVFLDADCAGVMCDVGSQCVDGVCVRDVDGGDAGRPDADAPDSAEAGDRGDIFIDMPIDAPMDQRMDTPSEPLLDVPGDLPVEAPTDSPQDVPIVGPRFVAAYTGAGRTPVSTTSAVSAVAGHRYWAALAESPQGSPERVTGVTGLGLTWSRTGFGCSGDAQQIFELWEAVGVPTISDVVTASYDSSPESAVIVVVEYTGVSSVGAPVTINGNGSALDCFGGPSTAMYSASVASSASQFSVPAFVVTRGLSNMPAGGFAERAFVTRGSAELVTSMSFMERFVVGSGTVAATGTLSGPTPDWIVTAFTVE